MLCKEKSLRGFPLANFLENLWSERSLWSLFFDLFWFFVCLFGWFWEDKVSLCSPGSLDTHDVDQTGTSLRFTCLCYKCWDWKYMPPYPIFFLTSHILHFIISSKKAGSILMTFKIVALSLSSLSTFPVLCYYGQQSYQTFSSFLVLVPHPSLSSYCCLHFPKPWMGSLLGNFRLPLKLLKGLGM